MRALLPPLLALLAGCQVFGGTDEPSPAVFQATVSGTGDVRTDAETTVVLGNLRGTAGVHIKGSGFPLIVPFQGAEGEAVVARRGEPTLRQPLAQPLPWFVAPLYRPGELSALSELLGQPITVAPPPPPPPPEPEPPPPAPEPGD